MLNTSYVVFVSLFLEVFCKQIGVSYSRADINATIYPLTVAYPNFSILQCGKLCIEDSCTEFLFNETNKQCNVVHCVNKAGYSYQFLSPKNDQILRFRKDWNWIEYMGHYYYYVEKKATWEEAKLECQKLCSYLVEINSKEESDWLAASFNMKDSCPDIYVSCTAWTGGNDRSTEGRFVWDHSNTLISFFNWYPTEPSPGSDNENCISLMMNGKWNDGHCIRADSYICEKNHI